MITLKIHGNQPTALKKTENKKAEMVCSVFVSVGLS